MQRGREREESATVSDQSAELPSGRTLPQRHNSTHAAGQAASVEGREVRSGEWGERRTGDNMALPDNTCSQLLT